MSYRLVELKIYIFFGRRAFQRVDAYIGILEVSFNA